MTLGEYIKQYRKQHNIPQDAFAKLAGFSKGYVATIELNKNTTSGSAPKPTLDIYYKVANATGVSPYELLKSLEGDVVINSPYSFEEQMLIYTYRQATDKEKGLIHSILDPYMETDESSSVEDTTSAVS